MSESSHSRPLVIVDDPTAAARLAGELESRGWHPIEGFDVPDAPWNLAPRRLLCVGSVSDGEDAAAALLAASRGAALVAVNDAERGLRDLFVDDLRRLGEVQHRAASEERGGLEPEERRLLELLAEGLSLKQAAAALYISKRTADRRLASARRALGVETTAEAVMRVADDQPKETPLSSDERRPV